MSNLEKWIKAILNEDADNLSVGSVRTLQMIKHEFKRLQNELKNADERAAFYAEKCDALQESNNVFRAMLNSEQGTSE